MRVHVGSVLHRYTGAAVVEAAGASVGAVMADLDRRFPGLRFRVIDEQDRVRPHMKIFVAGELAPGLATAVPAGAEVHILGALSGG
jgi:molybdopterin converting factor small subunit